MMSVFLLSKLLTFEQKNTKNYIGTNTYTNRLALADAQRLIFLSIKTKHKSMVSFMLSISTNGLPSKLRVPAISITDCSGIEKNEEFLAPLIRARLNEEAK